MHEVSQAMGSVNSRVRSHVLPDGYFEHPLRPVRGQMMLRGRYCRLLCRLRVGSAALPRRPERFSLWQAWRPCVTGKVPAPLEEGAAVGAHARAARGAALRLECRILAARELHDLFRDAHAAPVVPTHRAEVRVDLEVFVVQRPAAVSPSKASSNCLGQLRAARARERSSSQCRTPARPRAMSPACAAIL